MFGLLLGYEKTRPNTKICEFKANTNRYMNNSLNIFFDYWLALSKPMIMRKK